ncbi:uncharacterized protein LOC122375069 [Amphibalanus amphitrite]|uniref:uncharacterized protein LOC122375069 n=1 Tax=Amphibalanus amphitrite TaxID=1232801 RepID=UPI001C8FDB57|nr:uncharacterized protein LOC122375069 [Amphibalanus amphitrite]
MVLKRNPNSAKLEPLDKEKLREEENAKRAISQSTLYSGTGQTEYLPKLDDDEEHPMPYFITATATLPRPAEKPWESLEEIRARKRMDHWLQNKPFQLEVLDEFLADVIVDELATVASVAMQEGKYKLKQDQVKAAYIEEEIVPTVVADSCLLAVWELLVHTGRTLNKPTFEELEARLGDTPLDPVAEAALKQHVREEDDWKTSMDEEKALGGLTWETLVFHLHKIASSLTLSENFALSQLQDLLLVQSAGSAICEASSEAGQRELQDADEQEKVSRPPRIG